MTGYKTAPCTICGKTHDIAANCPVYQAICPNCKKDIDSQKQKRKVYFTFSNTKP